MTVSAHYCEKAQFKKIMVQDNCEIFFEFTVRSVIPLHFEDIETDKKKVLQASRPSFFR